MSALVASAITAVVTAALAILGTYVTTRRNLRIQYDASLRELRINAYKVLWTELEDLAKYARPDNLLKSQTTDLAQRLRKWYFETGGLYLSQETRQAYFSLLDGLEVVARRTDSKRGPEEDNQVSTRRLRGLRGRKNKVLDPPIPRQDDEFLRVLGSRLRTALTRDVGTRRTFMFRGDTDRASRVSQARTYSDDSGTRELRIATRWWQKLPIVGALLPGHPVLRLKGASSARWVPSRTAFLARISDSGDPRSRERRVFFIEPGQVVEGPEGWERTGTQDRCKSVIWKVES